MSDSAALAREHEREGNLERAGELYLEVGVEKLNAVDFAPNRTYRVGVATLIRSISCAARAGNERRAVGIRRVTRAAIEHIVATETDSCLLGLCEEWVGDIYLLTGSEAAFEHYDAATDHYDQCADDEQFSWGMEEEFEYAYWAVESFLDSREIAVEDALPQLDFDARMENKIDIAEGILQP